jgi:hypothetical protein
VDTDYIYKLIDMKNSKDMSRKLPEYTICGTLFTVDARIYEFRETAAPWNKILMDDFWEESQTHILFDRRTKNIYDGHLVKENRPVHVEPVIVPAITELDPVGLALHYNLPDEVFIPKSKAVKLQEVAPAALQQNARKRQKGRGI